MYCVTWWTYPIGMTLLNIIILCVRKISHKFNYNYPSSEENSTCKLTIAQKQIYLFVLILEIKTIVETYIEDINYSLFF
jgi:hypothetical protein